MNTKDGATFLAKLNTPDWRTLTPGKQDSDLFTKQSGFNDEDLTWWGYTTLTKLIYSGCVRRPFVGHI